MKKLNKYQKIAARFLGITPANWGKEINFAKALFKMFPNEAFWEQLEYPKERSLGYMFSPENKERIYREYQLFCLPVAQKTENLSEEKFGEDYVKSITTRQSLRDYLN